MGMYSITIMNNLVIDKERFKAVQHKYTDAYLGDEIFFSDGSEEEDGKFFGYWNQETIDAMNELAHQGIVSGELEFEYEEGFNILCNFSEKYGFRYKISEMSYPDEWRY